MVGDVRYNCPNCGKLHDCQAEARAEAAEARVRELEDKLRRIAKEHAATGSPECYPIEDEILAALAGGERPADEPLSAAMPLLARLASGEGGRRTGALKRAGYLEWTVTPAGLEALAGDARGEKG